MANPMVRDRFLPYREKPDTLAKVKHHTCNFFGAGSGGPEQYSGRSMPDTHRGMNISEQEYLAVVDIWAHSTNTRSMSRPARTYWRSSIR